MCIKILLNCKNEMFLNGYYLVIVTKRSTKMNKKDLVKRIGTAALVIGFPAVITLSQYNIERHKQEIIKNPARTVEYSIRKGDTIDNLLRQYSNLPDSVDQRDVREYTKEINGKKTSDLYVGEKIKLPVYKK